MFVVFSQLAGVEPPFEQLAAQGARFFASKLERQSRADRALEVHLQVGRPILAGTFVVATRPTSPDDLLGARAAETRGSAFGMADLATRCSTVWELTAVGPSSSAAWIDDRAALTMCAICASVALGPVLPPDHSTLFGVRGAIERRDASP